MISTLPRPVTGPDGDNPITDAQIRELRDETTARIQALTSGPNAYDVNVRLNNLKRHCSVALGERRARPGGSRAASRAFVAAAYNARHAGKDLR